MRPSSTAFLNYVEIDNADLKVTPGYQHRTLSVGPAWNALQFGVQLQKVGKPSLRANQPQQGGGCEDAPFRVQEWLAVMRCFYCDASSPSYVDGVFRPRQWTAYAQNRA